MTDIYECTMCVCPIIWISYNHLKLVTWVTTAHLIYPYNTMATDYFWMFLSKQISDQKTHFKITFILLKKKF